MINFQNSSDLTPVLEIKGVTKTFPGVTALNDVSFNCLPGEVHALVGENGAGKSTLLKILSGAYRPDKGTLALRGRDVIFRHPSAAQAAGISIIYQEFNLLPDRTVAQNIFLGREPMRGPTVDRAAMRQQTTELLESLGVSFDPSAMVGTLRVAQQQVIEIAKALSLKADIVLMDEPTAALSLHETDSLLALVRRLQARGITVIYISHRLDEVFAIADRVTILKDGHWVTTRPIADVSRHDLVSMMVGRELDTYFPPKAISVGEPVLTVDHVNVSDFLKDISFTVRRGEIVGIAGLEGSGRTFLARALFGAERISSGTLTLNGKTIRPRNPREAINAGIGFISEDRKREGLALGLSIQFNVALPSLDRRQQVGWIAQNLERKTVADLSRSLEIHAANESVEAQYLSGGNQQKVVLAKWLATDAKLLIFDEPTRGIDVGAKASIHQLMRDLASRGVGILMISSELPEVIGMSDRILVMRNGILVSEFNGTDITEQHIMQAATGTFAEEPLAVGL
jgi:ribose transport system ATP-binding protein